MTLENKLLNVQEKPEDLAEVRYEEKFSSLQDSLDRMTTKQQSMEAILREKDAEISILKESIKTLQSGHSHNDRFIELSRKYMDLKVRKRFL